MKTSNQNVAALDKVLGLATQLGDSYKPGNPSIDCAALMALLEESRKLIAAAQNAEAEMASAVNRRQASFEDLHQLGLRIRDTAESSGMNARDLHDLDMRRKRFRSQPFKSRDTPPIGESGEPAPARKNRSLSYEIKVSTLESVIALLEGNPGYCPTSEDLTLEALKGRVQVLKDSNSSIIRAQAHLRAARTRVKEVVFDRESGIHGKARMTKRYLRSILGADNDLYRSVSRIRFKTR